MEFEEIMKGMESPVNFKFRIGDKVHSRCYGYNAVITRRYYMEDGDNSKGNFYDVSLWQSSPPTCGEMITERWLEKGHRAE